MFLTEHIKERMNKSMDFNNDESELYGYIIDLAKSNLETKNSKISKIEKFLDHPSAEVRSAVMHSLLFVLKIDSDIYRKKALDYSMDHNEDEDLRVKCMSGLAQTYFDSKDKELLKIFDSILYNKAESMYIKSSAFENMLLVYGLSSREIFMRREGFKEFGDEDDLIEFNKEIKEIQRIINI